MVTATGAVIGIVYLRFWKGWALTSFLPVTKDTLNSGLSVLRTGVQAACSSCFVNVLDAERTAIKWNTISDLC